MKLTLLHRLDPEQNIARFYLILIGPSLVDEFAILRIWGRFGGHQHRMVTACESDKAAERLAEELIKRRIKHGYQITSQE